jgi:hypothetical protein
MASVASTRATTGYYGYQYDSICGDAMKDHYFYAQEPDGTVCVRWHDDQSLAQILEWPLGADGKYSASKVAALMNRAYELGKEANQAQVKHVLGITR